MASEFKSPLPKGASKSAWTVRGHLEVSATVARQRNLLYSVDKICWERIVTNFYSMRVSFSHLKGLLACFGHVWDMLLCKCSSVFENTTLSSALVVGNVQTRIYKNGYIKRITNHSNSIAFVLSPGLGHLILLCAFCINGNQNKGSRR